MSTVVERKANRIFDEFVTAFLAGESPDVSSVIERCPEAERSRIKEAIAGFLFAYENYYACQVSDELVESAVARLQRVRQRKKSLSEAKDRAAAESWKQAVTEPLLRLAHVLYPDRPLHSAQGIAIMNRTAPESAQKTLGGLDDFTKRVAERFARAEAMRLLSRTGVTTAPVPLDAIAEQLGLLVLEAPLIGLEGCLVTDGDTGGILLNSSMPDARRRRYTFAHEIGHYILHRRPPTDGRADMITSGNKDGEIFNFSDPEGEIFHPKSRQEHEASAFASYLLMPPALLPTEFGRDVPCFEMAEDVSDQFDVSLMAVLRRLVRESHHRTIFISSESDRTRIFDFSPEIDGYNRIAARIPEGSAAWDLWQDGLVDTYAREIPINIWFDTGDLANSSMSVIEESRRFETGHVYTLLNVIELR